MGNQIAARCVLFPLCIVDFFSLGTPEGATKALFTTSFLWSQTQRKGADILRKTASRRRCDMKMSYVRL